MECPRRQICRECKQNINSTFFNSVPRENHYKLCFFYSIFHCFSELGEIEDSDDSQAENVPQDSAESTDAVEEEAQEQKGKSAKRKNRQEEEEEDIISKYGLDDYDEGMQYL